MSAPTEPATGSFRCLFLQGALILCLVAAAYVPALKAGFVWDDDAYVTHNPLLTAPDGLHRIWFSTHKQSQYFPLTYSSFRLQYGLWGLNPAGYHAVNVILHGANALVVWWLLRRLGVPGAWLAGAIFGVHPVHVESVAWVTELKNTQSTFFYLLAISAWLSFADSSARTTAKRWFPYALVLVFHAAALFSKTTASTLPAALLLAVWVREPFPWKFLKRTEEVPAKSRARSGNAKSGSERAENGRPLLRLLVLIAPFLLMSLGMGLVSVWWERHLGNYDAVLQYNFNVLERLLIAVRALWFYIGKLLWPYPLSFSYPRWQVDTSDAAQYVWLGACVALGLLLWWKRRALGRGPVAAVLFFVAALSPLIGFIPLYTFRFAFVADHYQYVASIGVIALFSAAASKVAVARGIAVAVQRVLSAVLLLVLATLTWQQAETYKNSETLWRAVLGHYPNVWMARQNLAAELERQGNLEEALEQTRSALALKPDYAEAEFGLGSLYFRMGRLTEASNSFYKAMVLEPGIAATHQNLARCHMLGGNTRAAISENEKALQIKPDYLEAQKNLAWVLATAPEPELRDGKRALGLAENANRASGGTDPQFLCVLAAAQAESGRVPDALLTAQLALRLAEQGGDARLAGSLRAHLQRYQAGQPYHRAGF